MIKIYRNGSRYIFTKTDLDNKIINALILKLGNLEKQVHIRQRDAVDAAGGIFKYMPAYNHNPAAKEINYFCLTGYIEDGDDNPKDWIKLRPSTMTHRDNTDHIIVEDGTIFIEILPNNSVDSRSGIVYLTTIIPNGSSVNGSTMQRIKIDITQLGI